MSYNPSIPQADDLISESQLAIQTNFSQLNTIFEKDHVEYDNATTADRGKHKQSTYPDSSSDPATAGNELALYSKDVGGNSRFFMRQESSGTVIQLSGIDPVLMTNGYTFLPGGVIFQWGEIAPVSGKSSTPVSFPIAFPNTVFQVVITGDHSSSVGSFDAWILSGTIALGGFTIRNNVHNFAFHWLAIGN